MNNTSLQRRLYSLLVVGVFSFGLLAFNFLMAPVTFAQGTVQFQDSGVGSSGSAGVGTVDPQGGLNVAAGAFNQEQTLQGIVGIAVQIILQLIGIVLLIMVLYGGILWMTSEGDSGRVDKARGLLIHAGIGLVIVLASYAITLFVLGRLQGATLLGG